MNLPLKLIRDKIAELKAKAEILIGQRNAACAPDLSRYYNDPAGYARDVLGTPLWEPMALALQGLIEPPYKVSVDSGHGIGKTYAAAAAVNWWYDTRPKCWIITTAPTDRDVKDLLWTEIRLQRLRAKVRLSDDLMPAAAEMRSGPEHVAKGYTARDANSSHGRHRPNMLFVFDEKEGVQAPYWDGLKSMLRPGSGDAALVIGNPLTTQSRAYFEHKATDLKGEPSWKRVRLSSIDHPNISAGLDARPLPIAGAVTIEQVDMWVADWCDPVPANDVRQTDIQWREKWYRPGPIGEPRILGLRPSSGTYGVWSESLIALIMRPAPSLEGDLWPDALPVIGSDVANYGDDYTCSHMRSGSVSLRHHAANGWDHVRIASHLREEAEWAADWWNKRRGSGRPKFTPKSVQINLEDDATGRAVQTLLMRDGYTVRPVNASSTPYRTDLYRNARSEAWFLTRNKAAEGLVNLSCLPHADRNRIEQQLLAPMWEPDPVGRRVVEDKSETKKTLGRSPDDADAMNLAYYASATDVPKLIEGKK